MSTDLVWGRRYLICPPEHFDVSYAINPWMDAVKVDRARAQRQWEALVRTLRHAGAEIETLAPHPGLPDLVFTANLGLVDGDTCIAARMRHPERRDEPAHAETWFREHGYGVHHLGEDVVQEGAGDGLPFEGTLVGGYRTRSSASSYIGYREHVVKKGDTLTKIAKKHNVGVDRLVRANAHEISDPDLIHTGQVFRIPIGTND